MNSPPTLTQRGSISADAAWVAPSGRTDVAKGFSPGRAALPTPTPQGSTNRQMLQCASMRGEPHALIYRRRLLTLIALMLLLGAAINVLVAWTCSLWMPVTTGSAMTIIDLDSNASPCWATTHFRLDRLPGTWTKRPPSPATQRRAFATIAEGIGVRHASIVMHEMFQRPYEPHRSATVGNLVTVEAGLPFPALQATHEQFDPALLATPLRERYTTRSSDYASGQPTRWVDALQLRAGPAARPAATASIAGLGRPLLLGVRPVGFALNTLFWAGVIAAPALAPRWLRRARRRRRGLCVACGYDAHGLPNCPECGTPAADPRRAATP